MNMSIRILAVAVLGGLAAMAFTLGGPTVSAGNEIELGEAEVFIEWNSTDTDYGIQFFWDSGGFTEMKIKDVDGKKVLDVGTKRSVEEQGLTEGFFESVEPPSSELSMDEFLERFPEGDYEFKGKSITGAKLVGEAEFTHTLPAPPENLFPEEDDVVSSEGFYAGFDEVTKDTDDNPLDIELYVLVIEKEDDDPILQTYTVILRPGQTRVWVPEAFLEPDTEYKLEVIAQEESGNRTITEEGSFTTDGGDDD